jgi:L-ribulokinase
VLVPTKSVTSLGSALFAFMAAGTFKTIEEAQDRICPPHRVYEPQPAEQRTYDDMYRLFSRLYFAFGDKRMEMGDILSSLIRIAESRQKTQTVVENA